MNDLIKNLEKDLMKAGEEIEKEKSKKRKAQRDALKDPSKLNETEQLD